MRLGNENLQNFINEVLNKIQLDIIRSNAIDELEKVADKYNIRFMLEDTIPHCDFYLNNRRRAKILVLAYEFPNINEWRMRAKKKGIPNDRIEFQAIKSNFDYSHLENTSVYCDIIVGPVPHKGVGIENNSSFLAAVEKHPENYPKVHRMQDGNGNLIISQSAFERCLENTNFIRECL